MLGSIVSLVVGVVLGLFSLALMARFYMQWARVSLRNPLGDFISALTNWAVLPARRIIPGLLGWDWASLVLCWASETLILVINMLLLGGPAAGAAAGLALLVLGLVETLKLFIYLIMGVVIVMAVLSWVNPHAPLAPLFSQLARPFLRPLQRVVPPIANVDLSPLVLLLILQVLLMVISSAGGALLSLFR